MDPFVGRVVGDRYEILELLGVGGMGRVYRARHVGLDRMVAIKFIHPKQLASQAAVKRFMLEARAASRLSHPNVIAIHDFGGAASDGEELYLVMELLEGPSLGEELRGAAMPIPRTVDILCQILGALDEAHHRGITHRDIKPENIILTPPRSGGDHVKVIDFGVARVHAGSNLTQPGEIVGTPRYMAPEQARGEPAGPAADLYAVGLIMFQMLTGKRAFNGKVACEVIAQILSVERPDPCAVAPERHVPAPLAAVSMRAMALEPAARYPSAEAFARAIIDAAGQPWSPARALLFAPGAGADEPAPPSVAPRSSSTKPEPRRHRPAITLTPTPTPTAAPTSTPGSAPILAPASSRELHRPTVRMARVAVSAPLAGRTADLAWAGEHLSFFPGGACLAICGRPGIGRTRLLGEIASLARQAGAEVIRMAPGPPPPLGEVSGDGLRGMISRILAGTSSAGDEPPEMTDLRRLFVDAPTPEASSSTRSTQVAALRWAMERAVAAARGGRVLLEMDNVDRLDGVSQAALAGALEGPPLAGLVVAVTSEQPAGRWAPVHATTRVLEGLSRTDAAEVMRRHGDARRPRFGHLDGDIEPLYLELLSRWWDDASTPGAPPAHLSGLIEWRLQGLSPLELRIVQALAVMGRPHLDALAVVVDHAADLEAPLSTLERAVLVNREQGFAWLRHGSFGRVVLATATRGAIVDLHARAAAMLVETQRRGELCAYHALRGRPDLDAILLVEDGAQLRLSLGDQDGAIHLLGEGFRAARALVLAGELEAATWWAPLGRRFGAALCDVGRVDEAHGVLAEVLEHIDRRKLEHARVAEQLAQVAERRGRAEEALALLREALEVAEALNDDSLAARLRFSVGTSSSGIRRSAGGGPPSVRQPRKTGGDR